jgi:hypothetical protein
MSRPAPPYVAVVGASQPTQAQAEAAEQIGRALAEAGGMVVGILPGEGRSAANEWVTIALPSGLGELRNGLVVRAADAVVAVGGAYGTLSEIALALTRGLSVTGYGTWAIEGIEQADTPAHAAQRALQQARARSVDHET